MSATYTLVHFRLDFIMEANIMNPNQTDALKAVWYMHIIIIVTWSGVLYPVRG